MTIVQEKGTTHTEKIRGTFNTVSGLTENNEKSLADNARLNNARPGDMLTATERGALHTDFNGTVNPLRPAPDPKQFETMPYTSTSGPFNKICSGDTTMIYRVKDVGDFDGLFYGKPIQETNLYPEDTESVHFGHNDFSLREDTKKTLDQIAEYLKETPYAHVDLAGHTDSSGDEEYNMALSEKRVLNVKAYLEQQGVSPAQITLPENSVKGEHDLLVDTGDNVAKEQNRRVEVNFSYDLPEFRNVHVQNYLLRGTPDTQRPVLFSSSCNRIKGEEGNTPPRWNEGTANFIIESDRTTPLEFTLKTNNVYEQGFYIMGDDLEQASFAFDESANVLTFMAGGQELGRAILDTGTDITINPERLMLKAIDKVGNEREISPEDPSIQTDPTTGTAVRVSQDKNF